MKKRSLTGKGAALRRFMVEELPIGRLGDVGQIPISFRVESVYEIDSAVRSSSERFALHERRIGTPYVKDYDSIASETPQAWIQRFDVQRWGLIVARGGDRLIGSVVIALDTPGVNMLEGRRDLAVVWDIRVAPDFRRKGVGAMLLSAAESWARARGCFELKVETQNINVPACRFYARCGFTLRAINRHAYEEFPEEVQMLWYKRI